MVETPPDDPDFNAKIDALRDLPVIEEDPRFARDELVTCRSCSRSNPPNRTTCMYCGKAIEIEHARAGIAKINYKRPETWEDGYSLVYAGKTDVGANTLALAGELLHLESEWLEKVVSLEVRVPLIYLRSLPDAGLLGSRLSAAGFDCAIVGDDLLQAGTPPTRIRSLTFEDDAVVFMDFNTSSAMAVHVDESILIITGSLIKRSTELSGKISKRVLKTTDEAQSAFDEPVVDIYPANDVYGYRIRSSGFDFSCLGERMKPFAGANLAELVDLLRSRFVSATFINSFNAAAPLFSAVWPADENKQASEVTRGPLGGIRKHSITVIDNTTQFTKFSRLQRHFV